MRVAALTLAYNTPDLVASIRAQVPGVLVVDNGSEPPIEGAALRLDCNTYFSGGWNAAMRRWCESYDYLWLLNTDLTRLSQPMMFDLAETLQTLGPKAAAASPAYNSPQPWMRPRPCGGTQAVGWLDMAGVMVSCRAWEMIGEFDSLRFPGYGADVDWCYRAKLAGYRVHVVHDCSFHHMGGETVRRTGDLTQANAEEACRMMWKKWPRQDWTFPD